jgi:hypothetical protein
MKTPMEGFAPVISRGRVCVIIFCLWGALRCSAVELPPVITSPPQGKSVSIGANVSMQVSATGTAPITYQWQLNTLDLPGRTNRILTLTNVLISFAGEYRARAANSFGSVTSQVAVLDVDPVFTKMAAPVLNLAGGSSGISWVDYNNDGFQDLLIVGKGSGTALFKNNGDGTFGKPTGTGIPSSGLGGGSWADFDNDGYLDLLLAGANALYRNNGNGTFTKWPFNAGGINSYCVSWVDIDSDGFPDLSFGNYFTGGLNGFFHNNRNGTFTKITNSIPALDKSNSQGMSWGDYDNDGRPDLFVANTGSQKCLLYHNEGNGSFSKVTNSPVTTVAGKFACGAWGDYDNDGWLDLFVCGYNQKHFLWHNNRDGTFIQVSNAGSIVTDSGDDQTCAWADYDNDGYLDLFITSGGLTYGLKDSLYRNNGDGSFTKITRGSLVNDNGEGGGAAWGDFNRDGFPDLFVSNWQNISTGDKENYLYLNNGNTNNWLTIKCEGRVSNRAAIGAKVRIKANIYGKDIWQLREISAGGAYVSQHSLEPSFGLADATNVLVVRIEWPSGIVQELTNVAPRQFLVVREPSTITAGLLTSGNALTLNLSGGRGVGYSVESSPDLLHWVFLTNFTNQTGNDVWTNQPTAEPIRFFRAKEL